MAIINKACALHGQRGDIAEHKILDKIYIRQREWHARSGFSRHNSPQSCPYRQTAWDARWRADNHMFTLNVQSNINANTGGIVDHTFRQAPRDRLK